AELVAEIALGRPVLHVDDRLVIDVEKEVVRRGRRARDLLGVYVVARTGDIAEEVRLALGAGRVEGRRLLAQPSEHLAERFLDAGLDLAEALALDMAEAGLFEVPKLLDE